MLRRSTSTLWPRPRKRTDGRVLLATALAVAASLGVAVLVGCSDNNQPNPAATPSTAPPDTTPATYAQPEPEPTPNTEPTTPTGPAPEPTATAESAPEQPEEPQIEQSEQVELIPGPEVVVRGSPAPEWPFRGLVAVDYNPGEGGGPSTYTIRYLSSRDRTVTEMAVEGLEPFPARPASTV